MRFVISLILIFSFDVSALARSSTAGNSMTPNTLWLRKELLRMGLSKSFMEESLKYYEPEGFNTVVSLNLLGFLQPAGQHMSHVTPKAVQEASKFIKENQNAFDQAREKYEVPSDVISSLLWIETRHGEDVGHFHTVSVFLHLLQTNLSKNRIQLTKLAIEKNKKELKYTKKEIRKLMSERTKKKAQWAREQLIALASIRKRKHLNIKTLRGSYAGAFGIPQFIPSSYRDFAASIKPATPPNLSFTADAIMSVANYLSESGWRNKNAASHIEALMKYNNSRDYADSILEISKQVPQRPAPAKTRELSSTENTK